MRGACEPLRGRGRFETLADSALQYHLRHSSLTERTLLAYILICVMLATCLGIMGTELVYEPSRMWLGLLVIPVGALWILRYNGEILVDAQHRLVHLKIRRIGFWESAVSVPFDAITAVRVVAGDKATVELDLAGRAVVLMENVTAGIGRRLADRIGTLSGALRLECDADPAVHTGTPADEQRKGPTTGRDFEAAHLEEVTVSEGYGVQYRTVSPGTAAVLLLFSLTFGPLAGVFLSWALRILWVGPINMTRVMLTVPPIALLALCSMLFYAGLCLSFGEEQVRLTKDTLEGRVLLWGRVVRVRRIPLESVREVRVDGGIKILFGHEGIYRLAATLPQWQQSGLCARIHAAWQAAVPVVPAIVT